VWQNYKTEMRNHSYNPVTNKCIYCGVKRSWRTIPIGDPKNPYSDRTTSGFHYLVDGQWTYNRPSCLRKKYDREDFIEAMKKKLRKEKNPVKKQFYQDIVKEFDQ